MPASKQVRENQFQILGWVLFLVCSAFFIADSLASRSLLGLVGSVTFSLGCVVFLIPFTWKRG